MTRIYISVLLSILLLPTLAVEAVNTDKETVYRSVDETGAVEFSDTPGVNAEELRLKQPTVIPAIPLTGPRGSPLPARRLSYYKSIAITSPRQDENIRDDEGKVILTATVVPELLPKHRLEFLFDGLTQPANGNALLMQNVDRGTHQVQAQVIDAQGNIIIQSEKRTFSIQRHFIRPVKPKPKINP